MTVVKPTEANIEKAATTLSGGGVVAFATETVYGLGCDTFNTEAIEKVYQMKGRPINNPMIAHVLDVSWVHGLTNNWNDKCDLLASKFWPGPLTLILSKSDSVPRAACGGHDTIAIRCPSHPVSRKLLESFGGPISAPSANLSGHISPTTATHVDDDFLGRVQVIDGGSCGLGIESTILSMVNEPNILRLGSVSVKELESELGSLLVTVPTTQINAPGTAIRHYAPSTKVKLVSSEFVSTHKNKNNAVICVHGNPIQALKVFQMSSNPTEYARNMYEVLRSADAVGAGEIVIEKPGESPGWDAVNDRLIRCSSD
ncbi:MAG: L-threonylcarbamoyladenylate synthase [Phycisphaerales bacterium]|jgi:L-threonylcarbamoyladenylate synthase|nr:L-threonylcarbamoyladenylate synthase [Phycisphaerales bacterium]